MDNSLPDLVFPAVAGRKIVARFDGGNLSSDAGLLLLAQADRKVGLIRSMAEAITDLRQRGKISHRRDELLSERIFAIACGYEDANDLDDLRGDPLLKIACGRRPVSQPDLASQPTISRMENAVSSKDLLRMGLAIARKVIAQLPADTSEVVLDVDATDDPCHGQQEFEFYNRFYDAHCYLPLHLYVTGPDGRQWTLASLLRPGNSSYRPGLLGLLRRAVRLLRERFPSVKIVLRADAGFGYWDTLAFCDAQKIDYVLGLSKNTRLTTLSTPVQTEVWLKHALEGDGCREYAVRPVWGEFEYKAGKWPRKRRVVVKAEITQGKMNPRFIVSSLKTSPEQLYEYYCERGDRENRIKEIKLDLKSGRTSCHRFFANQMRLLLHTAASVLMTVLSQAASGTEYAAAQVGTLRVRLLKVAARVVESCRRVCFQLASGYADKGVWFHLNHKLSQPTA